MTFDLLIGPPPQIRCSCGWFFNFHHKARTLDLAIINQIAQAHRQVHDKGPRDDSQGP